MRNRCVTIVTLLVGLLAFGCSSGAYQQLATTTEDPSRAALESTYRQITRSALRMDTVDASGGVPAQIALTELGNHSRDRVTVLIHGVFADCTMWRFLAGDLCAEQDLLLVDLLGCGESDKPDPDKVGPNGYTVRDLAHRTLQAIRTYLSLRPDNLKVAIVAHSLGGAAVIRMWSDESLNTEFRDVLARVDRLVLLAPLDVDVAIIDVRMEELATASGWKIRVADTFGVLEDKVAESIRIGVTDPSLAYKDDAAKRMEILRDPAKRRAMQTMLKRSVAFKSDRRPDWEAIESNTAGYKRVTPPTLLLWGARDEVLPVAMGYKLAAQLGNAQLLVLDQTMHSVVIEQPRRCGRLIRQFIETGKPPAEAGPADELPVIKRVPPGTAQVKPNGSHSRRESTDRVPWPQLWVAT